MFSGTAKVSHHVCQFFGQFCLSSCACDIVVSAGKLRKLWDSLSELRISLCERRLDRIVLRPALLPVKTAQFTHFIRQVWRQTVKSLGLTKSVQRPSRNLDVLVRVGAYMVVNIYFASLTTITYRHCKKKIQVGKMSTVIHELKTKNIKY